MKDKYDQFASMMEVYEGTVKNVNAELLFREKEILEKVTKMTEWAKISYDQKRTWRRNIVKGAMRWMEREERSLEGFKFDLLFCDWDDQLAGAIQLLEGFLKHEHDAVEHELLFRLHSMFLIEQYLLNLDRNFEKSLHNDYYVMIGVMNDFSKSKYAIQLNVDGLKVGFTEMYKNWEKRPYKEI